MDDPALSALRRIRAAVRAGVTPRKRERRSDRPITGNRDPQLLGQIVEQFMVDRGLDTRQQIARVLEDWSGIVGPDVAAHVVVESFDEGRLVLRAESTTWAHQMRLLKATVDRRLAEELGPDAVTDITVLGPDAPSWRFGSRRVPGRGPRDTYG